MSVTDSAIVEPATMPAWLVRELRSDHAGETGAVWIYRGILALARDEAVKAFAREHLATEVRHLALIEDVLARRDRSILLALWRAAGFVTGALPAAFGARPVFATIAAVETFVDAHYAAQIARLDAEGSWPRVRAVLERCRLDEVAHRDDAAARLDRPPNRLTRAWARLVGAGSAWAVAAARRI